MDEYHKINQDDIMEIAKILSPECKKWFLSMYERAQDRNIKEGYLLAFRYKNLDHFKENSGMISQRERHKLVFEARMAVLNYLGGIE